MDCVNNILRNRRGLIFAFLFLSLIPAAIDAARRVATCDSAMASGDEAVLLIGAPAPSARADRERRTRAIHS